MTGPQRPKLIRRPPRILFYEEQDQLEPGTRSVLVPVGQVRMQEVPVGAMVLERAPGRRCPDDTQNGLCTWNDGGICRAHPAGECPLQDGKEGP